MARMRWLPSDSPAIAHSSAGPQEGYLVERGSSGVRILDKNAELTPRADNHLPRGYGQPIIWVEDVNDLPANVRKIVEG